MERTRKLWATFVTVGSLTLGLALCLGAAVWKPEIGLMLAGLYVPFATGCGAALHLFIRGNVAVHQVGAEK